MAEEHRILEPVNYELVTYTPADWVCLFEVRFSRSFPLVFWRAWPCASPTTMSGTAHSKSHLELCLVLLVRGLGLLLRAGDHQG